MHADQTVVIRLGLLAGLELGQDLPRPTVDDDEWLQIA
jgi:hypothetical protein